MRDVLFEIIWFIEVPKTNDKLPVQFTTSTLVQIATEMANCFSVRLHFELVYIGTEVPRVHDARRPQQGDTPRSIHPCIPPVHCQNASGILRLECLKFHKQGHQWRYSSIVNGGRHYLPPRGIPELLIDRVRRSSFARNPCPAPPAASRSFLNQSFP